MFRESPFLAARLAGAVSAVCGERLGDGGPAALSRLRIEGRRIFKVGPGNTLQVAEPELLEPQLAFSSGPPGALRFRLEHVVRLERGDVMDVPRRRGAFVAVCAVQLALLALEIVCAVNGRLLGEQNYESENKVIW